MAERRLALRTYRAILKWARDNRRVPFSLKEGDVRLVAAGLSWGSLEDSAAILQLARDGFRTSANLQGPAAVDALDRAFSALRLLHDEYGPTLERMKATRAARAACTRAVHSPGTVFTHERHGYRGVVYGWDPVCDRDAEWCAATGVDGDQPFYYVLPDENDCVRLFGGIRISKYVAQSNVCALPPPRREKPDANRIKHRALNYYFEGYSPVTGQYVPNRKLQFEYPNDDYAALVANQEPIGNDSNILVEMDGDEEADEWIDRT